MTGVVEAKGKVFFITGGANGIGAGLVEAFLKEDCKHVAFLDINESVGKEFERKLHETFGNKKSQFIKCDITNEAKLNDAFDKVIKEFKYIDVVINNAGVMNDARHIYRKEIELNVTALVTTTFKAIDLMRKDHGGKGGTVINLSSVVALVQNHVFPVYFGTKSAVLQFSNCIGMEPQYLRTGVRVITLCFGKTDTALITNAQSFDEETNAEVQGFMDYFAYQKAQSAVNGVVEAFKKGNSGSTWIATEDRPAKDITAKIKQSYAIMESALYEE